MVNHWPTIRPVRPSVKCKDGQSFYETGEVMGEFKEQVARIIDALVEAGYDQTEIFKVGFVEYEMWAGGDIGYLLQIVPWNGAVNLYQTAGHADWVIGRSRAVNESQFTDLIAAITK